MESAEDLAKRMFPGVRQIISTVYDFPIPIDTGVDILYVRPTIYYKADTIDGVDYCLYCLYWYKDNNHPFDFTGFIVRTGGTSFARVHWGFKCFRGIPTFSPGDHNLCKPQPDITIIEYRRDVDWCDMTDPDFAPRTKAIFGAAVTPPWTWLCPEIRKSGLIFYHPDEFYKIMLKG